MIEATQWWKNGDHPDDGTERFPATSEFAGELLEGKVVRYFRHPYIPGEHICKHCGQIMHVHGWIDTSEGGHIVCPGDWVITGVKGERYACKDEIFEQTYEAVE